MTIPQNDHIDSVLNDLAEIYRQQELVFENDRDMTSLLSNRAEKEKKIKELYAFKSDIMADENAIAHVNSMISQIETLKKKALDRKNHIQNSLKAMRNGKQALSAYGAAGHASDPAKVMKSRG